ncbi:hypothetical protein PR048_003863 [Dryococelus australis]|uniref:Uncharacterized protein n=1 Tax=Dryococelus australis TaxID=614101 RepID=A0ABQ9IP86_9NEOP|nr:hypothetical protein PR048_003863 [Dryococelus australis]
MSYSYHRAYNRFHEALDNKSKPVVVIGPSARRRLCILLHLLLSVTTVRTPAARASKTSGRCPYFSDYSPIRSPANTRSFAACSGQSDSKPLEKREIGRRKSGEPVQSSGNVATCENPGVTRPGVEPGSRWWEASSLTARPPRPIENRRKACALVQCFAHSVDAALDARASVALSVRSLLCHVASGKWRCAVLGERAEVSTVMTGALYPLLLLMTHNVNTACCQTTGAEPRACSLGIPAGIPAARTLPLPTATSGWSCTGRRADKHAYFYVVRLSVRISFARVNRAGRCRWSVGFLGGLPRPCITALLHSHLALLRSHMRVTNSGQLTDIFADFGTVQQSHSRSKLTNQRQNSDFHVQPTHLAILTSDLLTPDLKLFRDFHVNHPLSWPGGKVSVVQERSLPEDCEVWQSGIPWTTLVGKRWRTSVEPYFPAVGHRHEIRLGAAPVRSVASFAFAFPGRRFAVREFPRAADPCVEARYVCKILGVLKFEGTVQLFFYVGGWGGGQVALDASYFFDNVGDTAVQLDKIINQWGWLRRWSNAEMKGRRKRDTLEKTRRPETLSGTTPTDEKSESDPAGD